MRWETYTIRRADWTTLEAEEERLKARVREGLADACLLVSEPNPVYTGGLSSSPEDLLWGEAGSRARGIDVRRANRGGQWTYHGPGQVVLYPILRLETFGFARRGAYRFVHRLRDAVTAYLASVGVVAEDGDVPFGSYVQGKKIASFGIAVDRGVTSHGVALYLTPQGDRLAGIHPCGQRAPRYTSLVECGIALDWEAASGALAATAKEFLITSKAGSVPN